MPMPTQFFLAFFSTPEIGRAQSTPHSPPAAYCQAGCAGLTADTLINSSAQEPENIEYQLCKYTPWGQLAMRQLEPITATNRKTAYFVLGPGFVVVVDILNC